MRFLLLFLFSFPAFACPPGTIQYMRGWYLPPQPGQYTQAQLWNANKPMYVTRIVVTMDNPQGMALLLNSEPLDHSLESAGAGSPYGLSGQGWFSSSGHLRFSIGGAALGGQLMNLPQGSIEMLDFPVAPGKGILVRSANPGSGMRITFVWCE